MATMDRFRATYLNECAELLSDMEGRLVSLDGASASSEELNAIFRCAHSIKGGAGAFGFTRVAGFTHKLEALLDDLREGRIVPRGEVISVLLKAVDVTIALLQAESQNEAIDPAYGDDVAAQLEALSARKGQTGEAATQVVVPEPTAISLPPEKESAGVGKRRFAIKFVPHENLYLSGNDPLMILRELRALGAGEPAVDASRVPLLPEYDPEQCYLGWEMTLETERDEAAVRGVFEFVDGLCDLSIRELPMDEAARENASASKSQATTPKETSASPRAASVPALTAVPAAPPHPEGHGVIGVSSIRVDIEKIDRLVNMVGELVITQAMLQMQTRGLPVEDFPDLLRGVDELSMHMRELQEAVMSVRMQPVKSVFSRMPRIVRDIAQQMGKDIRLVMVGENTEIDKTIIEQLADPLTHMIRNAADHGIERPEERLAAGKPAQGTIILSAAHQGGRIVIEVGEDGAGLNRERILAKAREKGLIAPDAVLSEEAIEALIFLPGFSTAEKVSNISGRGVGMDVVKRNIEAMGGTVQARSVTGAGTRFTITLPLTLAILDGMIVRVGDERYIVPIANIVETMRPDAAQVHAVPGARDVMNVRGEFIPLLYLYELFGIAGAARDASSALVVLVESGAQKLGIVVDELIGQQQVVIKSLEANADPVEGVSGATILGNGRVSLILDVVGICGMVGGERDAAQRIHLRKAS